jgi:hypothetical protein
VRVRDRDGRCVRCRVPRAGSRPGNGTRLNPDPDTNRDRDADADTDRDADADADTDRDADADTDADTDRHSHPDTHADRDADADADWDCGFGADGGIRHVATPGVYWRARGVRCVAVRERDELLLGYGRRRCDGRARRAGVLDVQQIR